MLDKKINLDNILDTAHKKAIKGMESINSLTFPSTYRKQALEAMKEAIRQTLELAAENATTTWEGSQIDGGVVIKKKSITDVINLIKP